LESRGRKESKEFLGMGSRSPRSSLMTRRRWSRESPAKGRWPSRLKGRRETRRLDASLEEKRE